MPTDELAKELCGATGNVTPGPQRCACGQEDTPVYRGSAGVRGAEIKVDPRPGRNMVEGGTPY
jgi:hypothetical protein